LLASTVAFCESRMSIPPRRSFVPLP
jgi:hypothetical protein